MIIKPRRTAESFPDAAPTGATYTTFTHSEGIGSTRATAGDFAWYEPHGTTESLGRVATNLLTDSAQRTAEAAVSLRAFVAKSWPFV